MSRNWKMQEQKERYADVTSREGRVSRNVNDLSGVCGIPVTSREGRVSRNPSHPRPLLPVPGSRPARDV